MFKTLSLSKTFQWNGLNIDELKLLSSIALPLALSQCFHTLMGVADAIFLSKMHPDEMGSAALAIQCFSFLSIFSGGLLSMVGIYASYQKGRCDKDVISQLFADVILYTFLLGGACIITMYSIPYVLSLLHLSVENIQSFNHYWMPLRYAVIPYLLWVAMRYLYSSEHRTMYLIWTSLIGLLMNLIGNNYLGNLYGIEGIAYSTSLSYALMALGASFVMLVRVKVCFPNFNNCLSLLIKGFPVALMGLCDTGFFTAISLLVGYLSFDSLSHHYVLLQYLYVPFMIPYAFSIATSIRVAYFCGTREEMNMRDTAVYGSLLGILPIVLISIIYIAFLLKIKLLIYVAIFQIFNAAQVLLLGILRGVEDTFVPFTLTLLSYWFLGIPTIVFLTIVYHLELDGIWCGMIFAVTLSVGLLFRRVKKRLTTFVYT